MIEAASVGTNWTGIATMIGAVGGLIVVLVKAYLDIQAQRAATEERAKQGEHLTKQDVVLDLIHTASNSNLAASEQRNKDAEARIRAMADEAISKVAVQMEGLTAELARRDALKVQEAAAAHAAAIAALAQREAAVTERESAHSGKRR